MTTPVRNIINTALQTETSDINFISLIYNGAFEQMLGRTELNFYSSLKATTGRWDLQTFTKPSTHYLFEDSKDQIPSYMISNGVIGHNRKTHYINSLQLSRLLHVPFILIEHSFPAPDLKREQIFHMTEKNRPDYIIYPHKDIQKAWGVEGEVIPYGVPLLENTVEKDIDILIAGKFLEADYSLINSMKAKLSKYKIEIIGDNQKLSGPAKSFDDYQSYFARSKIFINLNINLNIPFELLYAMANKCVVLSNPSDIVKSILIGKAGLICSKFDDFIDKVKIIMNSSEARKEFSETAYNIAQKEYNIKKNIPKWKLVLRTLVQKTYVRNDAY